jgi:phenylacetate-CoA ligase
LGSTLKDSNRECMLSLEKWIYQIVGGSLGTDHVTRSEVEAYQLLRLRQTLQYSYEKSAFYRGLFNKAGLVPDDVRSLNDLSRLPFTEPHHLSESPYRFLCVSQAEVARPYSFVTSGTTGPKKKVFWSRGDLERIIEFMAAGIATVAGPGDVVQIMLADGRPFSQADLLHRGVKKLGATPVLTAMDLRAKEILEIVESSHTAVLFGYTSRLFRLTRELQTKQDLSATGVKVIFAAGDYMPEAMRHELQKIWNCRVHTHYGLTEMGLGVAVECDARDGYHFNEAGLLLEVVDPRTGVPIPAGEQGELVFTTLTRQAMPLIRYRTHDISRLIPDPCPCGSAGLLRIDRVRKRLESIVTLEGGDEIYLSLFDDVLFEVPGIIDYEVALTRERGRDRLEFTVEELSRDTDILPEIDRKLLSVPVIARRVAEGWMEQPVVRLVACGALQSAGRAKKLIVDSR